MLSESGNVCGACGHSGTLIAKMDREKGLTLSCQRCYSNYDFDSTTWSQPRTSVTIKNSIKRLDQFK